MVAFTTEELDAVSKAVSEAEQRTSGEIVPVLAGRSGNYERAGLLGGLAGAMGAVTAGWLALQRVVPSDDWAGGFEPVLGLPWVLVLIVGGFALGLGGVYVCTPLQRLLVGRGAMRARVTAAAADAFDRFHVKGTKAKTGVIIYVSLYERMVVVLGDESIAEKVDDAAWRGAVDAVLGGIRAGRPAEGMRAGIAAVGSMLSAHFPREAGDVDELSNELRVIQTL